MFFYLEIIPLLFSLLLELTVVMFFHQKIIFGTFFSCQMLNEIVVLKAVKVSGAISKRGISVP